MRRVIHLEGGILRLASGTVPSVWCSGSQTSLCVYQDHVEALLKCRGLGPTWGVFDSIGLGWDGGFAFLTSSR